MCKLISLRLNFSLVCGTIIIVIWHHNDMRKVLLAYTVANRKGTADSSHTEQQNHTLA